MANDQIPTVIAAVRAALDKKMTLQSTFLIGHWKLVIQLVIGR
jgi:hypothetical protein